MYFAERVMREENGNEQSYDIENVQLLT